MFRTDFLKDTEDKKVISYLKGRCFVVEYLRDLSVSPQTAQIALFMSEMNVHKKQLLIDLSKGSAVVQAGAMQWIVGRNSVKTDVKGAGDLARKLVGSKATGETAVKPKYEGNGWLVLEPTYRHLLICDMQKSWSEGIVLEDGMFLACDASIKQSVISRKNVSSALLGGEGMFNLTLSGSGMIVLESPVPRAELVEIQLEEDEVKIDGNYAVAWSPSLKFTVEKTTKSMIGSAASGEGFVNVYRGTGKVWMAPIR